MPADKFSNNLRQRSSIARKDSSAFLRSLFSSGGRDRLGPGGNSSHGIVGPRLVSVDAVFLD